MKKIKLIINSLYYQNKNYYLLVEASTNIVIIAGRDLIGFKYLSQISRDTKIIPLGTFSFFTNIFLKRLSFSETPYFFKWSENLKIFLKNNYLPQEKIFMYNLIRFKYIYFKKIIDQIEYKRIYFEINIYGQVQIDNNLKTEAQFFLVKDNPNINIFDFPFLMQFAEFKNLQMSAAAQMVIELYKLKNEFNLNSQHLLQKYAKLFKDSKSYKDVSIHYNNFLEEERLKLYI